MTEVLSFCRRRVDRLAFPSAMSNSDEPRRSGTHRPSGEFEFSPDYHRPGSGQKRVAPTEEDNSRSSPANQRLHLNTSAHYSDDAKEHICICAPVPKIPRPRNGM